MQIYHIFEMTGAKNGLGIIAHSSQTMKKLDKSKSLFQGTFEQVSAKKKEFIEKPWTLNEVINEREKKEQKEIDKLLKKHK